jgi:hypothetical protein
MRLRKWAALAGLVAALTVGATSAYAETISFFTHGWGMRGVGFIYFPHAFVVIERAADDPGGPGRESYGFTAANPNAVMLTGRSAGEIISQDEQYASLAQLHFSLHITHAQYLAVEAAIETWRNADGDRYDLDRRNCISFVAAIARSLGLTTPDRVGRNPSAFMEAVRRANSDRLAEATTGTLIAPAPQPAAVAAVPSPGSAAAQP